MADWMEHMKATSKAARIATVCVIKKSDGSPVTSQLVNSMRMGPASYLAQHRISSAWYTVVYRV